MIHHVQKASAPKAIGPAGGFSFDYPGGNGYNITI